MRTSLGVGSRRSKRNGARERFGTLRGVGFDFVHENGGWVRFPTNLLTRAASNDMLAVQFAKNLRPAHPDIPNAGRAMRGDEGGSCEPSRPVRSSRLVSWTVAASGVTGHGSCHTRKKRAEAPPLRKGGVAFQQEFIERTGAAWSGGRGGPRELCAVREASSRSGHLSGNAVAGRFMRAVKLRGRDRGGRKAGAPARLAAVWKAIPRGSKCQSSRRREHRCGALRK